MGKRGQGARFIEPMECLPVENIPEGKLWTYELKLDGYRLVAVKAEDDCKSGPHVPLQKSTNQSPVFVPWAAESG